MSISALPDDASPFFDDAQLQEPILRLLLACVSFAQQSYHGIVKKDRVMCS